MKKKREGKAGGREERKGKERRGKERSFPSFYLFIQQNPSQIQLFFSAVNKGMELMRLMKLGIGI